VVQDLSEFRAALRAAFPNSAGSVRG